LSHIHPYPYKTTNRHLHHILWRFGVTVLLFLGTMASYSQAGNSFKPANTFSDVDTSYDHREPEDDYEEISITLNVQRIGSLEIPAIVHGQKVYLSVSDLFDFLKIRNMPSAQFDSLSGFFINPKAVYLIDKPGNKIIYQDKVFNLDAMELLHRGTILYLRADYFGSIFGLDCVFDFRSLSVTLTTKIELPAIREMQQELMRQNISKLKGEKKADTTISRSYPLFHLGMADWAVTSSQQTGGNSVTRANLGIGALVAGGETDLSLNYYSDMPFSLRQQNYQWKLVNNDHAALRQVTAGKIFPQSTSTIYAPIIGLQFSNTPTTYRRSFGTYTLSNTTEPDWTVELYVNNILVNYTKADASGFYTFQVPMVYGNSLVKLRFYGPWGEVQTSEKYISIPFNFMPFHQLEYNVTGGMVDDGHNNIFSRATVNYGLDHHITIGGGMEYLSSVTSGKSMPFINASLRVGQRLLLSGEHTYGVRSKGIVSYRSPSNFTLDINYTRYKKDQTAVLFNYLDEKKLVLSLPIRAKKFTAFSRFTLNQFTLPDPAGIMQKTTSKYTSAELLFTSVICGISSNFTTYAVLNQSGNPLVYSNLSLSLRLPYGIRLTPQAQYEYGHEKFSMLKAEMEKRLFNRGFLNIAYQNSQTAIPVSAITIGMRYNFSFAQTYFSATKSGRSVSTVQSATGSLVYDGKSHYFNANNESSVGRGGVIISPYLDLNCNGRRDAGEPKAFGLNIRVNGGHIQKNEHDTTLRISGLEAYNSYFIDLDPNSFDNVAWQLRKHSINITVEPNDFKLIEVPVSVVGEVSGTVYLKDAQGKSGLGRIIVNIYNSNGILAAHTLTESDGYFSYLGLPPGSFTAALDATQLQKLKMISTSTRSFTISPKKDGDVADGLEFVMRLVQDKQ
jgi:hypothetical protein